MFVTLQAYAVWPFTAMVGADLDLLRRLPMNAHERPKVSANDKAARQREVWWRRSPLLPHALLLWHREDPCHYDRDGLTAYRELPLARWRCRDRSAGGDAVLRPATTWACRWWRAAPAPACPAARCRTRWA